MPTLAKFTETIVNKLATLDLFSAVRAAIFASKHCCSIADDFDGYDMLLVTNENIKDAPRFQESEIVRKREQREVFRQRAANIK